MDARRYSLLKASLDLPTTVLELKLIVTEHVALITLFLEHVALITLFLNDFLSNFMGPWGPSTTKIGPFSTTNSHCRASSGSTGAKVALSGKGRLSGT